MNVLTCASGREKRRAVSASGPMSPKLAEPLKYRSDQKVVGHGEIVAHVRDSPRLC